MDRLETLLLNAREKLGCSGLRNLRDLAQMRQETLEKRFAGAQHRLTVCNTLSIYTAWLYEKTFHMAPKDLHTTMGKWCAYLWGIGCTRGMARGAWTRAQTMLGPVPVTQNSFSGAIHMKIGSAITNQFPPEPIAKRKLAVLEDLTGSHGQSVERSNRQQTSSPSSKRHKASHVEQGSYGSPFRQPVPSFPQPVPIGRREFSSPVAYNREANANYFGDAARRAAENEAPWNREVHRYDFGCNPPRPSGGGSHWSPSRAMASNRERQAKSRGSGQAQRHPTPIKVEDRSPTPPPRVVSVGDMPVSTASQLQKPKPKQSWQINNVQNQITKHSKTSIPQTKPAVSSKNPESPAKNGSAGRVGLSSSAKFGLVISEANKKQIHGFGPWREVESGRLSPWEEDDDVVKLSSQRAAAPVQDKPHKQPLPSKPISMGSAAGTVVNKPLSSLGTPEGVCKPSNKENRPPQKTCIPSAMKVPAQQNVQHHVQFAPQQQGQIFQQPFAQHYTQRVMQQQVPSVNGPGPRVAPYPRMHSSPLSQNPVLVQQQSADKPLVGYHPSVTRLFRRRPNVWVRQTSRDVALDAWGEFSETNGAREYWAWEEYDPFNPLV